MPFFLSKLKLSRKKKISCGKFSLAPQGRNLLSTRKFTWGGKNMSFALPPAPEPWFLSSRRLERREGNICISLGSVTGTSIITGTMGSARAGRARDCSAPGFIFVRAWSGGGGDQVTVPEERLASPVLPPCVQHVRGSRERAGMGERGWAGREAAPPHWILSLGSACPGHLGGELPGGSLTLEPLMLSLDLA